MKMTQIERLKWALANVDANPATHNANAGGTALGILKEQVRALVFGTSAFSNHQAGMAADMAEPTHGKNVRAAMEQVAEVMSRAQDMAFGLALRTKCREVMKTPGELADLGYRRCIWPDGRITLDIPGVTCNAATVAATRAIPGIIEAQAWVDTWQGLTEGIRQYNASICAGCAMPTAYGLPHRPGCPVAAATLAEHAAEAGARAPATAWEVTLTVPVPCPECRQNIGLGVPHAPGCSYTDPITRTGKLAGKTGEGTNGQ